MNGDISSSSGICDLNKLSNYLNWYTYNAAHESYKPVSS